MFAWILLWEKQILWVEGRMRQAYSSKKKNNKQSLQKTTEHVAEHLNDIIIVMDNCQKTMIIWKSAYIFGQNSGQLCLKTLYTSFSPVFIFQKCPLCSSKLKEKECMCYTSESTGNLLGNTCSPETSPKSKILCLNLSKGV